MDPVRGRTMRRWNLSAVGGAIGFIVLLALAPAGSAAAPRLALLHSSVPVLDGAGYSTGCGAVKISMPQYSQATGAGRLAPITSFSKSCPKALGGIRTAGQGDSSAEIGAQDALKLRAAATTLSVGFNLLGMASAVAHGSYTNCPKTSSSGSYNISYGNATTNFSYRYTNSNCAMEAQWSVSVGAEVVDQTTGLDSSNGFTLTNTTGNYFETYAYSYRYSNPNASLGWVNSSSSASLSHYYGPSNSTAINWSPSVKILGSWAKGDHLQIVVFIDLYVDTILSDEHGSASAKIVAGGATGHLDITSLTLT